MMINSKKTEKEIRTRKKMMLVCSILIPLLVIMLFSFKITGYDFSFLPPIYATINGITSVLLIFALIFVKRKKYSLHQKLITICLILSVLFLMLYALYHITHESTTFGGKGVLAYLYYFLLISHILLSVVVIPYVLFTHFFAWKGDFEKHKRKARFTWPLWFYVTSSGVFVYILISPYY